MVFVNEVLEFLEAAGELVGERVLAPEITIDRVAPEEGAALGALSWLSASRFASAPARAANFSGALLIGPEDAPTGAAGDGWVVACRRPKLAFSMAVERFFPELLVWPWPTPPAARGEGSRVASSVKLAPGVVLGAGVEIDEDVEIGPNTTIAHTTVGRGTRIGANCSIGMAGFGFERSEDGSWFRFPHIGRVEIGADAEIGCNTCIDRGSLGSTIIGPRVKIDNQVHVAHNVVIEADSLVIAHAMLGGSARIGQGAWVAPSSVIKNQVTVGAGALIGLGAVVIRDVEPGVTIVGNPGRPLVKKSVT